MVSSNIGRLVLGDFNRDGIVDLAVVGRDANHNGVVSVLLGNGNGTFQAAVTTAAGSTPGPSVAVGDFNGDGYPDLALTNYSMNKYTVTILLGNGDGTFQQVQDYAFATGPNYLAVGDFNGDGH